MIKLLILDFDGVLNDGKVYFDTLGNVIKHYNVKDGTGITLLKNNNIEVGCISGFKENNSQTDILNHLHINYKAFSIKNKLEKLTEWCSNLKIDINTEVAYMGDDINDLECLRHVSLSGCPKNAHNSCLKICHFISKYNGGDGCVREFCDYILVNNNSIKQSTLDTLLSDIKDEFLFQINNFNNDEIKNMIHMIKQHKTIYMTGVGKSGNIAKHFSDLLKSVSVSCHFFEPLNSIHGDLGVIKKNDLVIFFSNSGNTIELLNIIPFIKEKNCKIIGICSNKNSKLVDLCDNSVIIPFQKELASDKAIPSNSIMSNLILCNIVTILLSKNISVDNYKKNHPYGSIGNKLKQIKDVIIDKYPRIIWKDTHSEIEICDILLEMTNLKIGYCFFISENNSLIGILTDGDIRRLLLKDSNKKKIKISDINTNYYYESDVNKYLKDCCETGYIPIIINNSLTGIIKIN